MALSFSLCISGSSFCSALLVPHSLSGQSLHRRPHPQAVCRWLPTHLPGLSHRWGHPHAEKGHSRPPRGHVVLQQRPRAQDLPSEQAGAPQAAEWLSSVLRPQASACSSGENNGGFSRAQFPRPAVPGSDPATGAREKGDHGNYSPSLLRGGGGLRSDGEGISELRRQPRAVRG